MPDRPMLHSATLRCIGIAILKAALSTGESFRRNDPRLPIQGTKNWELLRGPGFTPRHGHATCVFPCPDGSKDSCLWLAGGYGESHRTFDVETMENENSDVWWSRDGARWEQATELYGDFLRGVGNWDAKPGGYVAPWYSRYGHSLDALDGDGDGVADAMVLAGGFSPLPSNDVWISRDGVTWRFDGYAPWPKRAYHGATVFRDRLWILGGSPLSNDVWAGSMVQDPARDVGYRIEWEQILQPNEAPWTPRAAFCVVSQRRRSPTDTSLVEDLTETSSYDEYMFLLGGIALGQDSPLQPDDGTRSQNDVWASLDGISWERLSTPSGRDMPWGARSFHSCATWHDPEDRSRWVGSDSSKSSRPSDDDRLDNSTIPRIFLTGGGYMGRKGNNEVRELEAYTDAWWSYDGMEWVRINYEEGSKHADNLYSTNEWTETYIGDRKIYRGKWGHTLEAFYARGGLGKDGDLSCTGSSNETATCSAASKEIGTPVLFVIGGKLESGPIVSDVFMSLPGVHCEIDGVTCSGRGICRARVEGCICSSKNFNFPQEYC